MKILGIALSRYFALTFIEIGASEVLNDAKVGHSCWTQKCASSSLQASLRLVAQASKCGLGFCFLNPAQLRDTDRALKMNRDTAFKYVDRVISAQSSSQVVISHEMLGNRPVLVCSMAERALEKHSFDHVVISGYSRL